VLAVLTFLAIPLNAAAEERGATVAFAVAGDEPGAAFEASYALVIGNSDYHNGWEPLPGVKRDLEPIQAVLDERGFRVSVLENLGREEIDAEVRSFISSHGTSQNRLLFYFAGHGARVSNDFASEGYFVGVDAPDPEEDRAEFKNRSVLLDEIRAWSKLIDSRHALFVFDSCFSGAIFDEGDQPQPKKLRGGSTPRGIRDKLDQPVRQFITAGRSYERVLDDSVFCRYFVEGLEGDGDTNRDGYLTGTELGEYIFENVTSEISSHHPRHGKLKDPVFQLGDFVFDLPRQEVEERDLIAQRGYQESFRARISLRHATRGELPGSAPTVEAGESYDVVLVGDDSMPEEKRFYSVVVSGQEHSPELLLSWDRASDRGSQDEPEAEASPSAMGAWIPSSGLAPEATLTLIASNTEIEPDHLVDQTLGLALERGSAAFHDAFHFAPLPLGVEVPSNIPYRLSFTDTVTGRRIEDGETVELDTMMRAHVEPLAGFRGDAPERVHFCLVHMDQRWNTTVMFPVLGESLEISAEEGGLPTLMLSLVAPEGTERFFAFFSERPLNPHLFDVDRLARLMASQISGKAEFVPLDPSTGAPDQGLLIQRISLVSRARAEPE